MFHSLIKKNKKLEISLGLEFSVSAKSIKYIWDAIVSTVKIWRSDIVWQARAKGFFRGEARL